MRNVLFIKIFVISQVNVYIPIKKENLKQLLNKKYEKIFGNGRGPLCGNRFHKL